jgi:signal transduction histidine kinase
MKRKALCLFKFCLIISFLSQAQNQQVIDSLLRVLDSDITEKTEVETYVSIASNYIAIDSMNSTLYANRAIELANTIGYAEGSIDALYVIGVLAYEKGSYVKAKKVFLQMLELAKKDNYKKGMADALYRIGCIKTFSGSLEQALKDLFNAIEIYKEVGDKNSLANCFNIIGISYVMKSNYYKAIEYYYKTLELYEEIKNKKGMAVCYNNFGMIYSKMDAKDKTIENYSKALKIYKELEIKKGMARSYNNLGDAYFQQKKYDKALEHNLLSLKIKKEIGDKIGTAYTYSSIGELNMVLGNDDDALKYLSMALKLFEEININDRSYVMIDMGQIYRTHNQIVLARKYLNEGLLLAKNLGSLEDIIDGAEQLALLENKAGNYKEAYEAQVLFKKMADSLDNQETVKKITRLEAENEFKKEKDSLQFEQQQEMLLLQEEVKRKKSLRLGIYVILALILISGVLVLMFRNKIVERRKFQSLRNRISSNLHDEIGSSLSSISLFGMVADKSIDEDPEKAHQLLSRINSNATQTIESMNDIVWAINSENDSVLHLVNRMRSFASELEDTGDWNIKIDYDPEIVKKNLNMIQRKNLYLIYKEAVNNAVKYSNGDSIEIKMKAIKDKIRMEITDNGIGFEPHKSLINENPFGGNGLKNMKMRAKELGGIIKIISAPEKGTQIITAFSD